MTLQEFIPQLSGYNENSRVWVYQADRILRADEVSTIEAEMKPFVASWAHHGKDLKSTFGVLYNLFIVYVVDETQAEVGGCGIDSSVHLVQKLGKDLNVDFFNRLAISFFNKDKVECVDKDCFSELVTTDKNWSDDVLVFNNQINSLKSLQSNWIIPFKTSWHKDFFSTKDNFNLSL